MRHTLAALACAAAFVTAGTALAAAGPASAPVHAKSCGANYYSNVDGICVHDPEASDTPPDGATARCNDGTYSFSLHHRGTCSHHGGVAMFLSAGVLTLTR